MAVAVLALGALLLLGAMKLAGGQSKLISVFAGSENALQYAEKGYNKYLWELNKDPQFYLDESRYDMDTSKSDDSKKIYKPRDLISPNPDPNYRVEIEVPIEIVGDSSVLSTNKVFIRSTGWTPEVPDQKRTLQVEMVRRTFAQYGMITKNDVTSSGDPIYWVTGEVFYGPLHTNKTLYISGSPHFYGPVTFGESVSPGSAMTDSDIFRRGVARSEGPKWPINNNSLMTRSRTSGQGHYYNGRTCILLKDDDSYDVRCWNAANNTWEYNSQPYQAEQTTNANDVFLDKFKFYIPSKTACNGIPTYTGAFNDFRRSFLPSSLPLPANGVIYVNGGTSTSYSNSYDKYNPTLGNVFVSGTLKGKLTIAAKNDIFITAWNPTDWCDPWRTSNSSDFHSITSSALEYTGGVAYDERSTGFDQVFNGSDWDHTEITGSSKDDILGLVADHNIQILHYCWPSQISSYQTSSGGWYPVNTTWIAGYGWTDSYSQDSAPQDITIEGALFTTLGNYGYEDYSHGANKGTITLVGSIAENFRGPIGYGSIGYSKNYCHDPRMLYTTPPYYIEPANVGWQVGEWKEISASVS